jgi:tetratricopeptide (TPR) repeat protein
MLGGLVGGLVVGASIQLVLALSRPQDEHSSSKFDLDAIDVRLRAGYVSEALESLLAAKPETEADAREVAYRKGLCQELLGHFDAAEAAYLQAIHPDGTGWVRATLGQARCAALVGDLHRSRDLLNQVVLQSGRPDCRGWRTLSECLYLRARLDLQETQSIRQPDAMTLDSLAWAPFVTGAVDYLERLVRDDSHILMPGIDFIAIDSEDKLIARLNELPTTEVLKELARLWGRRIQFEQEFAGQLELIRVGLELEGVPLPEVLTAVTGRAGCGWQLIGDTLVIGSRGTPAVAESVSRAIALAPVHPSAAAGRIVLANLDFLAERWRDAEEAYQWILREHRDQPEAICAAYNLALVELRVGNPTAAKRYFLEVIDRDPHGPWADLGWRWFSRLPQYLRNSHR